MNKLIFDIETIPNQNLSDDLKPSFDETTVKTKSLKDPKKISDKIDAARLDFEKGLDKKMSLDANFNQIISIAYIEVDDNLEEVGRGVFFDAESDKPILEKFADIHDDQILVGWNSKFFDIPVVWKRGVLQNVKVLRNYKYLCHKYRDNSIDLKLDWNSGDFYSMAKCAKLLNIPCKTGLDGSMIYQAYKDKKFQEIQDYNMEDCEVTLAILKRLS